MWRMIADWVGPGTPDGDDDDEGLALGVMLIVVLTVSLPFLFGFR